MKNKLKLMISKKVADQSHFGSNIQSLFYGAHIYVGAIQSLEKWKQFFFKVLGLEWNFYLDVQILHGILSTNILWIVCPKKGRTHIVISCPKKTKSWKENLLFIFQSSCFQTDSNRKQVCVSLTPNKMHKYFCRFWILQRFWHLSW